MDRGKFLSECIKIIDLVLDEGEAVGKDNGDVSEWETKGKNYHIERAWMHHCNYVCGNRDEKHLEHAAVRALMAVIIRNEKWHNDMLVEIQRHEGEE